MAQELRTAPAIAHSVVACKSDLHEPARHNLPFEYPRPLADLAATDDAGGFQRKNIGIRISDDDLLIDDPSFKVRVAFLDHDVPVLAFAVEERTRCNIWRSKVEELGLVVGPWLSRFKEAILNGEPDEFPIPAVWSEDKSRRPQYISLGQLKSRIMKETKGRRIGYVVDAAFTFRNARAIVSLVKDADILFIESPFLHEDKAHAAERNYLTALQAGTLAQRANVKQLRTFHYSPRCRGSGHLLADESQRAFLGH